MRKAQGFEPKSERLAKLHPDQLNLALEDLELAKAEAIEQKEAGHRRRRPLGPSSWALTDTGPDVARDWISNPEYENQVTTGLAKYQLDGPLLRRADDRVIDGKAVALEPAANKLVRIAWAVLARGGRFDAAHAVNA